MYRVQRAQGPAAKPKEKAYTASQLRMARTFKEGDLDKVKLKQNFDDRSSKTLEVPVYDGGDRDFFIVQRNLPMLQQD